MSPEYQERDEELPPSLLAIGRRLADRYEAAGQAQNAKLLEMFQQTQTTINKINGEALLAAYRAGRDDEARPARWWQRIWNWRQP